MSDDQLAELAGSVLELEALLDYQEGAIVSRTLVDREAATLTVFACDTGQTISEHTAPHEALLQVLDGTARVTIDGTDHELEAGESIVFPAETPHAVAAPARFKMLLTMIK
ncbi:cupin domain-containing protein [Halorhabdus salina]|uniref:cupin domain-containing protein n=1 Tax=Halorhabdus salina TaxID=2750670 RepID=UPI0015EEEAB1|nr:cupin domain-containing protein [Halorhabdus salina]